MNFLCQKCLQSTQILKIHMNVCGHVLCDQCLKIQIGRTRMCLIQGCNQFLSQPLLRNIIKNTQEEALFNMELCTRCGKFNILKYYQCKHGYCLQCIQSIGKLQNIKCYAYSCPYSLKTLPQAKHLDQITYYQQQQIKTVRKQAKQFSFGQCSDQQEDFQRQLNEKDTVRKAMIKDFLRQEQQIQQIELLLSQSIQKQQSQKLQKDSLQDPQSQQDDPQYNPYRKLFQ